MNRSFLFEKTMNTFNFKVTENVNSNDSINHQNYKQHQNPMGYNSSENVLLVGCRLANSSTSINKKNNPNIVLNNNVLQTKANSSAHISASMTTDEINNSTIRNKTSISSSTNINNGKDDAQMVDFASSIIFPLSFILFNIVYWSIYLNMHVLSSN